MTRGRLENGDVDLNLGGAHVPTQERVKKREMGRDFYIKSATFMGISSICVE